MTQKGKIRSTIPASLKNGWNKIETGEKSGVKAVYSGNSTQEQYPGSGW